MQRKWARDKWRLGRSQELNSSTIKEGNYFRPKQWEMARVRAMSAAVIFIMNGSQSHSDVCGDCAIHSLRFLPVLVVFLYPFPRSFLHRYFCGSSSLAFCFAPSAIHAQKFIAAFMTFPLFIVLAVATRPETSMISDTNERSSASSRKWNEREKEGKGKSEQPDTNVRSHHISFNQIFMANLSWHLCWLWANGDRMDPSFAQEIEMNGRRAVKCVLNFVVGLPQRHAPSAPRSECSATMTSNEGMSTGCTDRLTSRRELIPFGSFFWPFVICV